MSESGERLDLFATPRDWLRYAISRFREANLVFGHGATTALDEAAYLILEGLQLPIDRLDPFLDARLTLSERRAARRADRSAPDHAQASRLSSEPRVYPGRALLCR